MAVSMASPGLARIPSHAEKIMEKPTSNPINSASRNATNSSASKLDLLGAGQVAAQQPDGQP
jgi:hypothetical protein